MSLGWVKRKLAGCSLESNTVGGIDVVELEFEKMIAYLKVLKLFCKT